MHVLIMFAFVLSATKSLSSGEVEAIIICCSLFVVGVLIIVIILSIFGFVFKKKQLQAVQTLNSTCADKRQQPRSTFHCAQNDEVNSYFTEWLCYMYMHVYKM